MSKCLQNHCSLNHRPKQNLIIQRSKALCTQPLKKGLMNTSKNTQGTQKISSKKYFWQLVRVWQLVQRKTRYSGKVHLMEHIFQESFGTANREIPLIVNSTLLKVTVQVEQQSPAETENTKQYFH